MSTPFFYRLLFLLFHVLYFGCRKNYKFGVVRGKVNVNSVPAPSVLVTLIFSLWAVMISFVMDNPSPVPFLSFPLERSVL